ncbi:MAG: hypothetical protein KDA44_06505, partial [Planctomycetales bacterium]|nr:hypothetical protein [Planctomycetales bacterium]
MKLPLLWRMILPTIVVSTLLLGIGLGMAVYVYRSNAIVSEQLDDQVAAVLAAEELVLAVRDTRLELEHFAASDEPEFLVAAQEAVARALAHARSLAAETNVTIARRLVPELERLAERIARVAAAPDEVPQAIGSEDVAQPLADAVAALRAEREAVTVDSRENRALAGRIGTSVALLGVCGAAAGIVTGLGVARGVARSVEELGGAVHSLHESLTEGDPPTRPPTELRELVTAMSHVRNQTAGMVTELERTRESAARADQLAAVGQLAAGIAHELRNPLTAVKLLVDSALDEATGLDDRELGVIAEETQRMQQMLQTFLDFARPPKPAMKEVAVDDLCRQAVEVARPRAKRLGIEIELPEDPQIRISADPQQLRQVLLNLLINAIDAQPDGGRICLSYPSSEPDGDVAIEVADAGPGIDDEVADRIFEPFVSTK